MTMLVNRTVPLGQSAVHFLIVGVGHYPHLLNGDGVLFDQHENMGQLSSPPLSACRLSEWARTMVPYDGALGSIDVLCSGPQSFIDDNGVTVSVESANLANVSVAAQRFYRNANRHAGDTLVFCFAGHGVSSGEVHSLLLEGFGSNPLSPFSDAIDAGAFIDGMRQCAALKQLFMFDACRTVPRSYLLEHGAFRGVPLISGAAHASLGASRQVALWSTGLGLTAYGRVGDTTVFTEAFLLAVQGSAARRDAATFNWVIETVCLQEGINTFIRRLIGAASQQFVQPGRMTEGFPLHVLHGAPIVPVDIYCRPEDCVLKLELSCSPGAFRNAGTPWFAALPHGSYTVTATDLGTGAVLASEQCLAVPPQALVLLEIQHADN